MKKSILVLSILFYFASVVNSQEEKVFLSKKVEALWKTSAEFKVPESVYYCKKQNALFVSNINGNPLEKDNNGFISKLTPDGNIINLHWVDGLNAPKGMGVYKERLFVTDIDRVAEIDLQSAKIVRFYDFPEALFLNDLVIDLHGTVYISDMQTNVIYKIYNGDVKKWIKSDLIEGPNGLSILDNFLFVGTKNKIVKINLQDESVSDYILNTGSIDGLICIENKEIIYSDWSGNVYITALGKETEKIIDTTPLKINAADIGFIREKNIILVPTFYNNRVMAYKLIH